MENTNSITMDGADLFGACLEQATMIVKQVLPMHYTNSTPDTDWDVNELIAHMLIVLQSVPIALAQPGAEQKTDILADDTIDQAALDINVHWQLAVDKAEAIVAEIDLDDIFVHDAKQTIVENFLTEVAGDLLIHAWDLGESIGMPVRFAPALAEAVMETTLIPNQTMRNSHTLFADSINPPANADIQARLLALFGRSYAWRAAA